MIQTFQWKKKNLKPQDATIRSLFYTLFFKVVQYFQNTKSLPFLVKAAVKFAD